LTRAWLLVLLLPSSAMAAPIVPQFTQGQLNSRVESTTVIQESITSYNYRTGYSYSAAGHNVETVGDVPISPDATVTNNQTVGGVNFSWTRCSRSNRGARQPCLRQHNSRKPFEHIDGLSGQQRLSDDDWAASDLPDVTGDPVPRTNPYGVAFRHRQQEL